MGGSTNSTWRAISYAGIGLGSFVLVRAGWKVYRLLSHHEAPLFWVNSIIPPSDYDFRKDCPTTKEHVQQHHPELLDIVEHGTLTLLTPPPDFDRALPEELYILGTAHVSRKTADAVYRTIYAVEPDAVVVELCKSRSFMMYREVPPEKLLLNSSPQQQQQQQPPQQQQQPTGNDVTVPAQAGEAAAGQQQEPDVNAAAPNETAAVGVEGSLPPLVPQQPAQGSGQQQNSAQPAAPTASFGEQLSGLLTAMKSGASPLQVLLSWAYMRIEQQLGTVVGVEFIRARHAIEDLEAKRAQHTNAEARLPDAQQQQQHGARGTGMPAAPAHASVLGQEHDASRPQQQGLQQQPHVHGSTASTAQAGEDVGPGLGHGDAQGEAEAGLQEASASSTPVHVYLGDVPLQRTLSRMWGVLRVGQKLRLCWQLLVECLTLAPDDAMLEQLMQEDMLQLLQEELGKDFPQVMGPLLHERNWQLAYTVHQAAQHGMKKVVLVVGRGHVPGVVYCLLHPYKVRMARKAHQAGGSPGQAALEATASSE